MDIENLRLKDITVFLELIKTKSIRELARQRGETPGQISKTVQALEKRLGGKLLSRSARGVDLTTYAQEILPLLEGIQIFQQKLAGHSTNIEDQTHLSIATTSFFSSHFAPQLMSDIEKRFDDIHCRLIDLPPHQFIPVALRDGFEVCIHLQDLAWPKTWTSIEVGRMKWRLVCRKGHAVLQQPQLKTYLKYPFVRPVYWTSEGLRPGDDHFPLPKLNRIKGFETATAASAAEFVARSNHLGFLPSLAVDRLIKSGKLKVLESPSLRLVSEPVFLTVKSDRVKQSQFLWLQKRCQELLSQI